MLEIMITLCYYGYNLQSMSIQNLRQIKKQDHSCQDTLQSFMSPQSFKLLLKNLYFTYHHTSISSAFSKTARFLPSRTNPISQLLIPCWLSSAIKLLFCSCPMHTSSPPLVSAAYPSSSLKFCTFPYILMSPLQTGSLLMTSSTWFFWASARQLACPSMPNPVTSVQAWAWYLVSSLAPTTLRVAICSSALQKASSNSDSEASCSILSLFSLLVLSHCMALMARREPSGLVSMIASPG